jgi:hypothetical protein
LPIEPGLEVPQIGWVGWIQADLVQERIDVVERSDGVEGSGVFGAEGAPYGGEEEGGVDLPEGDAAIVEDPGQAPILGSDVSQGAGGAAIVVEDRLHVELAFHEFAQP